MSSTSGVTFVCGVNGPHVFMNGSPTCVCGAVKGSVPVCSTGYCQCAAKDAELERLRAEVADLKHQLAEAAALFARIQDLEVVIRKASGLLHRCWTTETCDVLDEALAAIDAARRKETASEWIALRAALSGEKGGSR